MITSFALLSLVFFTLMAAGLMKSLYAFGRPAYARVRAEETPLHNRRRTSR